LDGVAEASSAFWFASFALRPYRDIKSCPSAFDVDAAVVARVAGPFVEGIVTWGWNDGGGYKEHPVSLYPNKTGFLAEKLRKEHISVHRNTYRFQTPPGQDPLCRRRNAAAIPLQVPHDLASAQLREHLRDLLHLGRVDGIPTSAGPAASRGIVVTIKEPSEHKEGYHGQCEKGGYIQRRLIVMHGAFCRAILTGFGLG